MNKLRGFLYQLTLVGVVARVLDDVDLPLPGRGVGPGEGQVVAHVGGLEEHCAGTTKWTG